MAEITASLVKELRGQTGAGMMDCKRALIEVDGEIEKAVDWLRQKGLSTAAKKASRVASEGLIALSVEDAVGAIVEVNAETDFVARNEEFQNFVGEVASLAVKVKGDIEQLKTTKIHDSELNVESELTEMVGRIGENMVLRRSDSISVKRGVIGTYIHNAVRNDLGKIGVLVGLESDRDENEIHEALLGLARKLAMHICAARPEAVDVESLDSTLVDRERSVLIEQAKESGKPIEIIDKMVDGRLRKYYEEVVLMEQIFVVDGENKVSAVIDSVADEINAKIKVNGFLRFELGEGIERIKDDFAEEVAAQAGHAQ